MPRRRRPFELESCFECDRLPSEQLGHNEDCASLCEEDPGDCDCGEYECSACGERRKWMILAARLREDIRKLEEAGYMMEKLVKYSRKVKTCPGAAI